MSNSEMSGALFFFLRLKPVPWDPNQRGWWCQWQLDMGQAGIREAFEKKGRCNPENRDNPLQDWQAEARPKPGQLLSSHFHRSRTSGIAAPSHIASLPPGLVAWTAGVTLVRSWHSHDFPEFIFLVTVHKWRPEGSSETTQMQACSQKLWIVV